MKNEPRCTIDCEGTKRWFLGNKIHRKDGPAVEYTNEARFWWLNGKLHRDDGPAAEWSDESKAWYLNGYELHPEEAIQDPELQEKYPKLIESMIIHSVHNS